MGTLKPDDDQLVFSDPKAPDNMGLDPTNTDFTDGEKKSSPYKLLIVDDENQVHIMTKLVLSDYIYKGSGLQFFSGYSVNEAKQMLKDHPDAACILLDVVMETSESGLEIVRYIREDLKNELLRIILRTGQPGKAPEKDIILNYDINDYKEKTELTSQKLFTSITTALRSYTHLLELDNKRKEITAKNIRLNEEIAKRIVAEHNLTKYNRSLEKMLDQKSTELKASLLALELKEKELLHANRLAAIGDVSSASIKQLDAPGQKIEQNLETINQFRSKISALLEKYEIFQTMISSNMNKLNSLPRAACDSINDLDCFKNDIQLDVILARYPEIIQESANSLKCISHAIDDIRQFVFLNDICDKPSDINAILKKSIERMGEKIERTINLQSQFSDLPSVNTAAENMENAFFEIIKNAYEAISSQGIISISTEYNSPDILIHISDVGCGITPEDQEQIFKPYFTKNKPDTARGLGLCLANAVVKSAGGQIGVTSKPNEGTCVTIRLPAPIHEPAT